MLLQHFCSKRTTNAPKRRVRSLFSTLFHPSYAILLFALGIIIGDILVLIFEPTFFANTLWIILAILILILTIFIPRLPCLIATFLAGALLISARAAPIFLAKNYLKTIIGTEITITGKVIKDPDANNGKTNIVLGTDYGNLFIQLSGVGLPDNPCRSDILTVKGVINDGFGTYSGSLFRPEVLSFSRPEPGDLFLDFRDFFASRIRSALPEKEASLGIGYLLGQKSGVDQSFQDTLRIVGLTHIIVASGAHLSTLVSFARKIFGKLSRFASFLSAILLVLLFIGITGLSASMLRAGLVTFLSLLAWYFGRSIHPARLLVIVVATTLLVSPEYLIDLAWLLSFASFTGIMVISPMLTSFFYGKDKSPGLFGSTLLSSLSATFLTAPILLYFFGQLSLISLLANLLILPTISIAMGLTLLTGLFPVFSPLAQFVLDYQITIVEFLGTQKNFLVQIDAENPAVLLLYFLLIPGIIYICIKKQRQKKTCLNSANLLVKT